MTEAPRSKTYTLTGIPHAFSNHAAGDGSVWTNTKQMKLIAGIELERQHADAPLFRGMLSLYCVFYFPMPVPYRSKKRVQAGQHYPDSPSLFTLLQFVSSVAQKIVFEDNSLIVQLSMEKRYDSVARTEFTVTEFHEKEERKNPPA